MVTITKEERDALRELVASVTLPLPWKSDSDGVIVSDLHDFVADCDGTGGDFIDPKPAKLIAGAVNALPKALDALDAADKRIADLTSAVDEYKRNPLIVLSVSDEIGTLKARVVELETEQGELHRELARLRGQLATAREDASEMEKKAIAEGSEALALRAEVVALKADRQWRKMEYAPRDGSAIFAMHATGRVYQVTYQQRVGGGVWEDLDDLRRDTDDFLCWLPIPELMEGGA